MIDRGKFKAINNKFIENLLIANLTSRLSCLFSLAESDTCLLDPNIDPIKSAEKMNNKINGKMSLCIASIYDEICSSSKFI
jgi:hypothetical protein